MKDFYDINELASQNSFNLAILTEALKETFSARETDIKSQSVIFSDEFKNNANKEIQWKAFLIRTSLTSEFSFKEIVNRIEAFINTTEINNLASKEWNTNSWSWESK
jgi:hypothetical protein